MAFHDLARIERRQRVARLLRTGATEGQIAMQLGVSRKTIVGDVAVLRAEWQAAGAQDRDEWIAGELGKLEAIEAECWRLFYNEPKGRLFAIDRILAVMERRARLLGLDAAKRVQVEANIRAEVERIAQERDLPTDEVMAEVMRILGEAAAGE